MRIARAMQWVGYLLVAMAGMLRVISGGQADPRPWLVAYAVFAIAFHVGASAPERARRRRIAALAVMVPAMLAMALVRPCPYGALALVVVASQAALVLAPVTVAVLAAAQTSVVGVCVVTGLGWVIGGAEVIALCGFQAFAVAAIVTAQREAEARAALTRMHERTRIARDLHDVLGHDLTALALQLEVAGHVDADAARVHTANARAITARLLADMRNIVAATRDELPPVLAAAIRAIVVDAPGLAIHLDAPESLAIREPTHTDCVVRCVQEIVTNTRRHAKDAANLWVCVRREADDLVVEAHDDGTGATVVRDGGGLRGMRSRFEELGGALVVRTAPAFGVTARLPLGARA